MCCGQKRSELRSNPTHRTAATVQPRMSGNNSLQSARAHSPAPRAMGTVSHNQPIDTRATGIQPQMAANISTFGSSISIRYLENSPVRVRGPVSGLHYDFSGSRPVQAVDSRDALSLLKTRFFRRA